MLQTFNSKSKQDFLLEIGCEEIPARLQDHIGSSIQNQLKDLLEQVKLPYESIQYYAGPRRIAIYISQLATQQQQQTIQIHIEKEKVFQFAFGFVSLRFPKAKRRVPVV